MTRTYTKEQLRTELAKSGLVRPRPNESIRVLRRHVVSVRVRHCLPWSLRVRAWSREAPFFPPWRILAVDVAWGLLGGLVVGAGLLLSIRGLLWP